MKALEIQRAGSPVTPNVRFTETRPSPQPGPGEVLVRTEAAALNQLDLAVGRGLPGVETAWPMVSGSDGAGIVEEVGAGVAPAWKGQRVLLNAAVHAAQEGVPGRRPAGEDIRMIGEHSPGCLAEFFVAPATNVLAIGDADPVQAAAFGLTFLTAWRMLISRAAARSGSSVLITGIGGGVALAALAISRWLGCTTIVTSRHRWKLERAQQLGADHAVLDTGEDWSREVRMLTGKRGVDVCIESVGKVVHGACIRSMARAGTLVTCGATSGFDATTDLGRIFWNQLTISGSTMGSMEEFREVTALFRSGSLKPVVDRVYAAPRGVEAFARLESGEQFGKLVVDWRPGA